MAGAVAGGDGAAAVVVGGAGDRLHFNLSVPFPSVREAQIALGSLSPDCEPRKGGISRTLSVQGCTLQGRWVAHEARILRVSVSSFLDHLSLVLETMDRFGPPSTS
ncbi:L antigen family member 3-like [Leucoraja erinacea]|uniref:L antigen family member 3-like n=1 Tax=Leucoraja erinaceus TaxID=7782 RepID=UPI002458AC29|nr:L antigen family member 3-like [Leucoraja erinacea]